LQKEACVYAKVTLKKRKRVLKKWTSVQDIKIIGTSMPTKKKKREKRDV
jgi:hypothetical protein